MRELKKTILRSFFALEIIVFAGLYFFGIQGMQYLWRLKKENSSIEQEINELQNQVIALEEKIDSWRNNPFYPEKMAREQLQMARAGEKIYYI